MANSVRSAARSLGPRLLTAAVGFPLLMAAVWAGNPWLALLAVTVGASGLREILVLANAATTRTVSRLILSILGAGYVSMPLAAAVALRSGDDGLEWLCLALVGTFATDTSAYAVGRTLGRSKMVPAISPAKTWEGAMGGLLGTGAITLGLATFLDLPISSLEALGLGLAIGVLAQFGDLGESYLKRRAGAKDSGILFPGHGGLLDRFDSLALVFPLVYLFARVVA